MKEEAKEYVRNRLSVDLKELAGYEVDALNYGGEFRNWVEFKPSLPENAREELYEIAEELKKEGRFTEEEIEKAIEELEEELREEFEAKVKEALKEVAKERLLEELREARKEGYEGIGFAIGVQHVHFPYRYCLEYKVYSAEPLSTSKDVQEALERAGEKPHAWGVGTPGQWANYWFVAISDEKDVERITEDEDFNVVFLSQNPRYVLTEEIEEEEEEIEEEGKDVAVNFPGLKKAIVVNEGDVEAYADAVLSEASDPQEARERMVREIETLLEKAKAEELLVLRGLRVGYDVITSGEEFVSYVERLFDRSVEALWEERHSSPSPGL